VLVPKLITTLRGYTRAAIVAGGLISLLGGSRVQIGGPTGAFVVIVAGIAVLIASTQITDLLGLDIASLPTEFVPKWERLLAALPTASTPAIAIGVGTVLLLAVWPKVSRRIPGPFVALVLGSVAVAVPDLPVETIGSRFGAIPSGFPEITVPTVTIARFRELVVPTATIAMLGAIESLLSAVVADGMVGGRHRSNMELVAQGVANFASPLVGGIPATGAIARTATNAKNGATTPVAGLVHALTLLLITLFAAPLAARVPMATLAEILCVVAYHMSE
jgi:sulfate permease, SulP family